MSGPTSSSKSLNTFLLSMMTLGLIIGIPVAADLAKNGPVGITIIFFGFLAAFVPSWLVCSRLGTMFRHDGGVYLWVREAFGPRSGFQAIWIQWTVMVVFLTASLSVAASSFTFLFNAEDELGNNRIYLGFGIILIVWLATAANLLGVRSSGKIAAIGVFLATLFPGIAVIVMGLDFLIGGGTLSLNAESGRAFIPDLSTTDAILPGYTAFLGLEVTAVFILRLRNPGSQYPRALLFAGLAALVLLAAVALVIMSAIPTDSISSEDGIMSTIKALSEQSRLGFLVPLTAISIAVGWIGLAGNIFIGPATGLLTTARYGHLPSALTKENRFGSPTRLLFIQAVIATLVTLAFISFSDVQTSFDFIVSLATMLYAVMYVLMYSAALKLRRRRTKTQGESPAFVRAPWIFTLVCIWGTGMAAVIIVNGFTSAWSNPTQGAHFVIALAIAFLVLAVLPQIVDRRARPTGLTGEETTRVEDDGEIFLDERLND
ncbi:MAG: hypothetical protein CMH41_08690 [Micrococcales bacterium]|nr:hypothetical protein [Micrococcales bacterium]